MTHGTLPMMDAPVPANEQLPLSKEALNAGAGELHQARVDEAELTAELLLAFACGVGRGDLHRGRDRRLTHAEWTAFRDGIARRCMHEPLQYITGETEFMGLRLDVRPGVLIPRPETEHLVEEAERFLRGRSPASLRALDIGTGSGNIAIALAARVPGLAVDALERFPEALVIARENAARHHVVDKLRFIAGDCFADEWIEPRVRYDLIVSNPPYISSGEFVELDPEIRLYEPTGATTDYADGLSFYRRIAFLGARVVTSGGAIVVEIAYNQGSSVPEIFREAGYADVAVLNDYAGHPRVVSAR